MENQIVTTGQEILDLFKKKWETPSEKGYLEFDSAVEDEMYFKLQQSIYGVGLDDDIDCYEQYLVDRIDAGLPLPECDYDKMVDEYSIEHTYCNETDISDVVVLKDRYFEVNCSWRGAEMVAVLEPPFEVEQIMVTEAKFVRKKN